MPDSCGAGESVNPKQGDGLRRAIGGLLACPICTGIWAALVFVGLYALNHNIVTVAILVLGAAGASEFIYYAKERYAWSARLARVQNGKPESRSFTDAELAELFVGTSDVER